MATFQANPNDTDDPWIETAASEYFRKWHVMFFCFSAFTTLATLICCCIKFRIPRTKQEIEGDYRRKKLAEKFQEKLRQIQRQDMDVLDLQQALKLIQEDFDQENLKFQANSLLEKDNEDVIIDEKSPVFKFYDLLVTSKLKGDSMKH